jgi:Fe(3+) dicitrate transport protein
MLVRPRLAAQWFVGSSLFVPLAWAQPELAPEPPGEEAPPAEPNEPPLQDDAPADVPNAEDPPPEDAPPAEEAAPDSSESEAEEQEIPLALSPPDGEEPEANVPSEASPETVVVASAPEPEQEIRVVGSKASRAAGSVHVIREDQLDRFEYDDMGMALVQVPGVYIRQEDGMGLRPNIAVRGVNPDRSKKLTLSEDGVLFGPAPYSAPAGYFFPLLTRMTQVHVLKGPSAIAHGPQTVGGAIDLISRPIPLSSAGRVDLSLGDYGYNKGHAYFGTSTEQFGFLVEGVRLQNTGFTELPSGADTGSTRNEWMLKASYMLDPTARTTNEFLFKFVYSDEVSNETYLGQTDADFRADPYRRYPASALDQMKLHRTALSLTHLLESTSSPFKLKTTAYRHDYQRTWRKLNRLGGVNADAVLQNPDDPINQGYYQVLTGEIDSGSPAEYLWIGPNNRRYVSQGLQTQFTTAAQTGPIQHNVEGGIRVHNDSIVRQHTEDAYMMVGGELVYANQATITTTYGQAASYALAVHVADAMTYRALTVTPGIRTELILSEVEDYLGGEPESGFVAAFMPGAGIYYEFLPGLGALAGVYRGFSPPPPGSDDTVQPEYSVNYELGARYSKQRTRLEVIGFYNDYQNMTDVCSLASGCLDDNLDRQFDAGQARIYGLEAYVAHEAKLPSDLKLPLSLAYTYSQGEFLTSFESLDPIYGNVLAGDKIPYLPPHQLTATLALEHRYGGANAAFNYVARMREIAGRGELIDTFATDEQVWLDTGLFGRPLSWLTIYGNVRNVTGEQNLVARRPYGARPNAPRWFQVGAKAEF